MKKIFIALVALPLLLTGCKALNGESIKNFLSNPETLNTILEVNKAIGQQINGQKDQSVMIGNTKVVPQGTNPGVQFNYGGAQRMNGDVAVVFELVNETNTTIKKITLNSVGTAGSEYCYALNASGGSYGKCKVYLVDKLEENSISISNVAPKAETLAAVFVPNVPANATSIAKVNLGVTCVGADGQTYNFSYLLENVEIDKE